MLAWFQNLCIHKWRKCWLSWIEKLYKLKNSNSLQKSHKSMLMMTITAIIIWTEVSPPSPMFGLYDHHHIESAFLSALISIRLGSNWSCRQGVTKSEVFPPVRDCTTAPACWFLGYYTTAHACELLRDCSTTTHACSCEERRFLNANPATHTYLSQLGLKTKSGNTAFAAWFPTLACLSPKTHPKSRERRLHT